MVLSMVITVEVIIHPNQSGMLVLPDSEVLDIMERFPSKRVLVSYRKFQFHAAILKRRNIGFYIMLSKEKVDSFGLNSQKQIDIMLKKDTSMYQIHVPESFQEVLLSDEQGLLAFESLSPGKQRSLIAYVSRAKRESTQIGRALRIMENLKFGHRDFRQIIR